MHSEWASLSPEVARQINDASLAGGRIVAVGTTAVRTLEWAATGAQGIDPYDVDACPWKRVAAFEGETRLFIRPGYRFRAVDAMITNFHLPRSTLLMLVSAFAGKELIDRAYQEGYRRGISVLLVWGCDADRVGRRNAERDCCCRFQRFRIWRDHHALLPANHSCDCAPLGADGLQRSFTRFAGEHNAHLRREPITYSTCRTRSGRPLDASL